MTNSRRTSRGPVPGRGPAVQRHRYIPWRHTGGVKVWLHSFVTSKSDQLHDPAGPTGCEAQWEGWRTGNSTFTKSFFNRRESPWQDTWSATILQNRPLPKSLRTFWLSVRGILLFVFANSLLWVWGADPCSREQNAYGSGRQPEFCTVVWGLTLRLCKL